RNVWEQGDFPFYYVQIAPYDYGRENADKTEAAQLRKVQLECMRIIPNSGMAVTADIGERTCIHPAAKNEVGERLALWALSQTYGQDGIPFSGPLYKSAAIKEKVIEIEFEHSEMGMTSHGEDITGFELAGADGVFYPATAKLISGTKKISLENKSGARPVSIRYCFKNYQPVNLFSNFGLPVSPFEATLK
ncbi:MAG: sialate O-acetylesterase, partial [Prevotella sp.]|nr:sialate O-acetylesterase [Prevotella sp.]